MAAELAHGRPFGKTGVRITTTRHLAMEDEDKSFGMDTMCAGGCQGMSMVVERLN